MKKKMLLALILLVPVFGAWGDTFSVDPGDPTADFDNIQDAIDIAFDGDTIVVSPGTYNENIRFRGKAIEVTSLSPGIASIVENTIISVSGDYSVRFDQGETAGAILTGFTITGRGIYCDGSSPTISRNIITNCNNNAITGANNASPLIQKNTITFNGPTAIYLCYGDILENTISHNGNRGGLRECDGAIIGNKITHNFTTGNGGGLSRCDGYILDNIISYNKADGDGGGIHYNLREVTGNTIISNRAGNNGGGLEDCSGFVGHNIIAGNQAMNGSAIANSMAEIHNNTITGNRVEVAGTLDQCPYEVENNIIAFNTGPAGFGGLDGSSKNLFNCFWENSGGHFSGGAMQGAGDLIKDPCFAEPGYWDSNGTAGDPDDDFWVEGDYHIRSEYGRWNPGTLRWVYDSLTSPCVDAGLDYWDWKEEYWPHGAVINQGRYGGTSQASMSYSIVGNVADLDLDGLVDFRDLMMLCDRWPDDLPLLREDLDRNGRVDLPDYAMLVANWQPLPPPNPNPMTWEIEPNAISSSAIAMKASAATSGDGSGVEYRFEETTGNPGGSDRDWHRSPSYTDTGLVAGETYCYIVTARNIGNDVPTISSPRKCAVTWSAPNPNPMTWSTEPTATSWDAVTMRATAAEATDGNVVEYYFKEVSGNFGGNDRGWEEDPVFTDVGLYDGTTYCYRVKARNKSNGLDTGWSAELCAITPIAPPPTSDPIGWSMAPDALTYNTITMLAEETVAGDGSSVEYYFENLTVTDGSQDRSWNSSRSYTDTSVSMNTEYCYRVKARNARNKEETGWSSERCATTPCNDSTPPSFPLGYWENEPCEQWRGGSEFNWWGVMTAAEADDDGNGDLEYHFVCTNGPWSSGWQTERYYEIPQTWGRSNQGFIFYVEVRDECKNVSSRSADVLVRRCQ